MKKIKLLWILLISCIVVLTAVVILYCRLQENNHIEEDNKHIEEDIKSISLDSLSNNDIIKDHVHKLNSSCPIDMNNGSGLLESVFFDGEKISYNVKCLSDLKYSNFTSNMKKYIGNLILYLYVIHNGNSDEFLEEFIDRKCNLHFNIYFSEGDESSISIPYSDMVSAKDYANKNRKEALKKYVYTQIELINTNLPVEQDEGLILHSMEIENNYITYNYNINEEYYDFFKADYDEAKMLFYKELKNSSLAILESCKAANLGVQIKMIMNGTSKIIRLEFPYSELMKDPFIINLSLSKVCLL